MPQLISYKIESFATMTADVEFYFEDQKLFEQTNLKILTTE
jgi:hypothetical protein